MTVSRGVVRAGCMAALGGLLAGGCSGLLMGLDRLVPDVCAWTAWSALLLAQVAWLRRSPAHRTWKLLAGSVLAVVVFALAWAPVAFAQRYSFLAWIGVTPTPTGLPPLDLSSRWAAHWLALGVPFFLLADLRLPAPAVALRHSARWWLPPLTALVVWGWSYGRWEDVVRWQYQAPRSGAPFYEQLLLQGPASLAALTTGAMAALVVIAHLASRRQPGGAQAYLQVCTAILSAHILAPALVQIEFLAPALTVTGIPAVLAVIGFGLGERLHDRLAPPEPDRMPSWTWANDCPPGRPPACSRR